MKIALIRQQYNPFGGAEKFVETAVESLSNQGTQLTIITRKWPKSAASNIDHRILNPAYFSSTGRDRSFADSVRALLKREKFDLVQSHERIAGCDIYRAGDGVHAEWLLQRQRVLGPLKKFSVTLSPHHHYLLNAERALFNSPTLKKVICNSRMVRDEIRAHFNVPAEKLQLIYSGVDTNKFQPTTDKAAAKKSWNIQNAAPVLVFVGSGFERKGLNLFLHALANTPKAYGLVVGKDKKMKAYISLAEKLGIASRTIFTGGLNDVQPAYAAADVLVLPTLYDPFPNAALEAFACGLPVITSNKSGAAELIVEGINGFVRDALDLDGVVSAIEQTLSSNMTDAARAKVEAFTVERMAQEYVALYRSLLGV